MKNVGFFFSLHLGGFMLQIEELLPNPLTDGLAIHILNLMSD